MGRSRFWGIPCSHHWQQAWACTNVQHAHLLTAQGLLELYCLHLSNQTWCRSAAALALQQSLDITTALLTKKMSLHKSITVVRVQCLAHWCIVLESCMSLYQVSLYQEITVATNKVLVCNSFAVHNICLCCCPIVRQARHPTFLPSQVWILAVALLPMPLDNAYQLHALTTALHSFVQVP